MIFLGLTAQYTDDEVFFVLR